VISVSIADGIMSASVNDKAVGKKKALREQGFNFAA
jgi:hypothetical protein